MLRFKVMNEDLWIYTGVLLLPLPTEEVMFLSFYFVVILDHIQRGINVSVWLE